MMMMMMMTLLLGDDEPPLNLAAEGPHGDYRCRDERRGVDSPCVEIYGHDYCFDDKADFSNILQPSIVTGNDVELVVCYYVSDLALAYYTVFQKKGCHLTHGSNFVKSEPIFKLLSPLEREGNFQ